MRLLDPQLQAFLAIVKNKTVHAAAHELCITQTAVTQRIKTLEIRLATSLFVRTRRGMTLTIEGEGLLRYCHEAQELEGAALSFITKTGKEKNVFIRITGPTTIMHTRIIPSCITVMKHFPNLFLQFDISDNENVAKLLRQGHSQLAIIQKTALSNEMEYKNLKPEQYILVAPNKWKKRKLSDILQNEKIIDFDPEDQMTFNYLKQFRLIDFAVKDRHFVNSTDKLAFMIMEGLGYGVLPIEFAKPYLANKKLIALNQEKTYSHLLALAWFPRHQIPTYFSALIKACV